MPPTYAEYKATILNREHFKNSKWLSHVLDLYMHLDKDEYDYVVAFAENHRIPSLDSVATKDTSSVSAYIKKSRLYSEEAANFDKHIEELKRVILDIDIVQNVIGNQIKFIIYMRRVTRVLDAENMVIINRYKNGNYRRPVLPLLPNLDLEVYN